MDGPGRTVTTRAAETARRRPAAAAQSGLRYRVMRFSTIWQAIWRYVRILVPAAAVWYLLARWLHNEVILPTPIAVGQSLVAAVQDGSLQASIVVSLMRLGIGFGIATLVGLPLGAAMGLSNTVRFLVDPVIELLRPISGIAWIPLALLLFGVGNTIIVYIIFYGCLFPIVLNSVAGVREVDDHLIQAAEALGLGRARIIMMVILPGALPTILTGVRIATGVGWMALVAAELVGAHSGLGFSVQYYSTVLRTPLMMGYIVVIGILGMITNVILLGIQRLLTPWAPSEG